jgi:hypothetical protein
VWHTGNIEIDNFGTNLVVLDTVRSAGGTLDRHGELYEIVEFWDSV